MELIDKKLELEIELLKVQLDEKLNPTKPTRWTRINNWVKKWSITILTIASIIGGIWGVFYPIKTYYNEKSKELQFSLNQSMINLVNDLYDTNRVKKNSAIVLLSYYEENAIPILLYHLENSDQIEEDLTLTISRIYTRKPSTTMPQLSSISEDLFNKESEKAGVLVNINGLINYSRLFQKIDFEKEHLAVVERIKSSQDSILAFHFVHEIIRAEGEDKRQLISEIQHIYEKNPDIHLPIICSTIEDIFKTEAQKQASTIQPGILNYSDLFMNINLRATDTSTVIQTIDKLAAILLNEQELDSADHAIVFVYLLRYYVGI